jgi:hypothetical protein
LTQRKQGFHKELILDTAADSDVQGWFLRIVRFQVQKPAESALGIWLADEVYAVSSVFFHFLDPIIYEVLQVETAWFQLQGPVQGRGYVHGFGAAFTLDARKQDIRRLYQYRNFDEHLKADGQGARLPVIGAHAGGFSQLSLVSTGVQVKCYFAFPARGNNSVERRDRASSGG